MILRQLRHLSNPVSSFSTLPSSADLRSPEVSTGCSRLNIAASLAGGLLLSASVKHMFKISTIETSTERRLIVEGALIKPWVAELRKTWNEAGNSLDGRKMIIDLTNATIIDPEGEAAISELMQEGAKFCCSGVLTKHVLKQIAHKCQTTLSSVLEQNRGKH